LRDSFACKEEIKEGKMIQIKKDIYWVGHIDWDLRVFHGYRTPCGSTYNAYLIKDKFPTLIDTVKYYGADDMIRKIFEVIDPKEIKYVIANHAEMDHSGSIERVLELCPNAEVVCSVKGVEVLKRHFKKDWKFHPVKSGDVLDIGERKLTFLTMPMVHWPESMATFSPEDKILFPNDAFGQHFASEERYADEVPTEIIFKEAAKYYANIVLPYGMQVAKVLESVATMPIEMICPSHGLIWRKKEDLTRILGLYKKWANHETENKVVIAYDTMWHSTEKMAQRLKGFLEEAGVPTQMFSLEDTHVSDIMTEILSARFLFVGTPMLNNRMLPTVASFMMYAKGLQTKKRLGLTFGSYGWAKIGFKELEDSLVEAGVTLLGEGRYIPFIPDEEELNKLKDIVPLVKNAMASK